jgi:hypothetical protein
VKTQNLVRDFEKLQLAVFKIKSKEGAYDRANNVGNPQNKKTEKSDRTEELLSQLEVEP